jgi:hypothetical protein
MGHFCPPGSGSGITDLIECGTYPDPDPKPWKQIAPSSTVKIITYWKKPGVNPGPVDGLVVGGGGHSGGGHFGRGHSVGGQSGGGQGRVDAGVVPVQHTATAVATAAAVANPHGTAASVAVDPQGTGIGVSPGRAGAVVTDHQADVAVVSVQLGATIDAVVPVWTVTVADVVVSVQWAVVGAVGDHRKTRGGCSA